MVDDRRAHVRIDTLEEVVKKHLADHSIFETNLAENTVITRQIAENTSELVAIVKGAKGFRRSILWLSPIIIAVMAIWTWLTASHR